MSDTDPGDAIPPDDEGMLALRVRERSLAADTGHWSVDSLGGTYALTADGDEDLEDDALILGGHGYINRKAKPKTLLGAEFEVACLRRRCSQRSKLAGSARSTST